MTEIITLKINIYIIINIVNYVNIYIIVLIPWCVLVCVLDFGLVVVRTGFRQFSVGKKKFDNLNFKKL